MFAILLSDAMDPFYQNISSFPTAIFTFLLLLCVLFWLAAVIGIVDIDFLDVDLPDLDTTSGAKPDEFANPNALAGLLLRFGMQGVPVTISLTLAALVGWLFSYYAVHMLSPIVPDGLIRVIVGVAILFTATYVAMLLTAILIKPLRPLFAQTQQGQGRQLMGQKAIVRTSVVDRHFGEAIIEDGGAGLLLKVRSTGSDTFKHGDVVVLLEYLEKDNAYRVISEAEFDS